MGAARLARCHCDRAKRLCEHATTAGASMASYSAVEPAERTSN